MKQQRKLSFFLLLALLISLGLSSCRKDKTEELTEEEATEIMETSMKTSTGGASDLVLTFAEELETQIVPNEICDSVYSNSYPINYTGTVITASYNVNWEYELTCGSFNIPESVELTATSTGTYSTARVTSNDNSTLNLVFTGLHPSGDSLVANGTFVRNGSQELRVRDNRDVTSTLNVTFTDLIIDKDTYTLTSGTAVLTLSGTTDDLSFSFSGTLTFLGNGQATLTVNGNDYPIDLN